MRCALLPLTEVRESLRGGFVSPFVAIGSTTSLGSDEVLSRVNLVVEILRFGLLDREGACL